ncbi:MAG TPA: tRNA lysidine(34) synthetase TilS, partial [Caulifigura sp.]|nr:tRNA lysidine(34) synthetase TilS [Caulifigura sp.]
QFRLQLVVAHFDHGLRADSTRDAAWLEACCAQMELPFRLGRPHSAAPASHIESWARRERYSFLLKTAEAESAPWIAVGHTSDDDAETILHHIIRGTGLAGLTGIPWTRRLSRRVQLIRPCIKASRAELRAIIEERRLEFREDASNTDRRFTRNTLRHDLIPLIEQRFNPRFRDALLSLSRQATLAQSELRRQARRILRKAILEQTTDRVRLSRQTLVAARHAVRQEAVVVLWRRMQWPRQNMSRAHWERAASLLGEQGSTRHQFPGHVRFERRGDLVIFERTQLPG